MKLRPPQNVCLRTNKQVPDTTPFPFQFVYETLPGTLPCPIEYPHDYCLLVTEGTGSLQSENARYDIKPGDLLFIGAGCSHSFTRIRKLKFIYISFVGENLPEMLAEYGITEPITVFPGFQELADQWFSALRLCTDNNLTTLTKGLLYYALALLPLSMGSSQEKAPAADVISQICAFLDKGYGNSALSLEYVCQLYSYHPNYISRRFRELVGCSFTEYLQNCRIHHAKSLLLETDLSIQAIAAGVGYRNALYFSKVFSRTVGMPPSKFRQCGKLEDVK